MAPESPASRYFAEMIASYDSLIRRAVPRYEEMTERLMAYLPTGADRILELGCGTGNLTLRLVARYPRAHLTAVDAAPEMVELTRARVTARHPSMVAPSFVVSRFEDLAVDRRPYDLVVSCISLHHVREKRPVFEMVRRSLGPGGTFRFADQMAGATGPNHEINWSAWLDFCRRPGHCGQEEIDSLVQHAAAHDHYESVVAHLDHLRAAGFVDPDCVWRDGMWAVLTADGPDRS